MRFAVGCSERLYTPITPPAGAVTRPHSLARDGIAIVTLNLNTGEYEGGLLRFPEFGRQTYEPPLGGAIVFSCSLLHEALPVTAGERYAFLPFLYDDAAAKLREANMAFVDVNGGTSKE